MKSGYVFYGIFYGLFYAMSAFCGAVAIQPQTPTDARFFTGAMSVMIAVILTIALVSMIKHNRWVTREIAEHNSQPGAIQLEARWL